MSTERRPTSWPLRIAAGCGVLALAACACSALAATSLRLAMPEAGPPVEVAGDCPRPEAQAFVDGAEERLAAVFAPVEALEEADSDDDLARAVLSIDVAAMEAAVDRAAALEVPACAEGVLQAEIAFAEAAVEIVDDAQGCFAEGEGAARLCLPRALLAATTRLPALGRRMGEGYEALGRAAGVELPEDLRFGGGEGGMRIEIDGDGGSWDEDDGER